MLVLDEDSAQSHGSISRWKNPSRVAGECGGNFFDSIMSDGRHGMRWAHTDDEALELVCWPFSFWKMGAVLGLGIIINEQIRKGTEL